MTAAVLRYKEAPIVLQEIEMPAVGAREVLVRVKAASINRRDWWIQKGLYAGIKFPIVLGADGSGVIEAVGKEINVSELPEEVIIYPVKGWGNNENYQSEEFSILGLPENGTFAEFVKVPVDCVFPKPQHLSFEEAASLPVAGLTAYRALFVRGGWQQGDKVLISGVGGGAGAFALQWALAAGAEVWATSGSDEKLKRAVSLGASGGINYKSENWEKELKSKAGDFNVIIDSALGDGFAKLVTLAARGARIVFFGGTDGNIPALNGRTIFWKQLSILGTTMGSKRDFAQMLDFVSTHKIKPIVDAVFELQNTEEAIRSMDAGSNKFGKIVLRIG